MVTPGFHLMFRKVHVSAVPTRAEGGDTQARCQVISYWSWILGKLLDLSGLQFLLLDKEGYTR